jgi:hypothetical protein
VNLVAKAEIEIQWGCESKAARWYLISNAGQRHQDKKTNNLLYLKDYKFVYNNKGKRIKTINKTRLKKGEDRERRVSF